MLLLLRFLLLYFHGRLFLLWLLPLGAARSGPLLVLLPGLGRLRGLLSMRSLVLLAAGLAMLACLGALLLVLALVRVLSLALAPVGLSRGLRPCGRCRRISSMHLPHEAVHELRWVLLLVLVAFPPPPCRTGSYLGLAVFVLILSAGVVRGLAPVRRCSRGWRVLLLGCASICCIWIVLLALMLLVLIFGRLWSLLAVL